MQRRKKCRKEVLNHLPGEHAQHLKWGYSGSWRNLFNQRWQKEAAIGRDANKKTELARSGQLGGGIPKQSLEF